MKGRTVITTKAASSILSYMHGQNESFALRLSHPMKMHRHTTTMGTEELKDLVEKIMLLLFFNNLGLERPSFRYSPLYKRELRV